MKIAKAINKKGGKTVENNTDEKISERLFSSGSEYFKSLLSDIASAEKSIFLETYIFKNDVLGKQITHALIAASQRGITVKFQVDGCGNPYFGTIAKHLELANIEVKIYHPFPWHIWNWSRSVVKLPLLLKWIYLILKIARRNHRKICLIDDNIAYIGSMNICKDHISHHDGGDNWRDIGVRLTQTNFSELINAMESCWYHRSPKEVLKDAFKKIGQDPIIRLNNTRHRRRILYKHLLRRMRRSTGRIWITNAYFVPDNRLLRQLKEAAKNGVDVRIILPHKGDTFLPMPWAASAFYYSLLKANIRIFEYLPSILHAKSIIIDDWMMIGSTNLDYLSLFNNLEVDVRLTHPKTKSQVESFFAEDSSNAKEISIDNLALHRPWYQRFIGRLMLYGKYLI